MDFKKNSMQFYKIHYNVFKLKRVSDLCAYNTLQENVKYYKEYMEKSINQVDNLFKNEDKLKIWNITKALKGELMNLNKKYKKIDEICINERKIKEEKEI